MNTHGNTFRRYRLNTHLPMLGGRLLQHIDEAHARHRLMRKAKSLASQIIDNYRFTTTDRILTRWGEEVNPLFPSAAELAKRHGDIIAIAAALEAGLLNPTSFSKAVNDGLNLDTFSHALNFRLNAQSFSEAQNDSNQKVFCAEAKSFELDVQSFSRAVENGFDASYMSEMVQDFGEVSSSPVAEVNMALALFNEAVTETRKQPNPSKRVVKSLCVQA